MPDYIPLEIALKKAEEFYYYHNDLYNLIKKNELDIYCYYEGYLGQIDNYLIDRGSFELDVTGFKKYEGEIKILLRDNILNFFNKTLSNTKLEDRVLIDYVSIPENGSYLEYCIVNLKPESHKINLPCKFSLITNKRLDGLWLGISDLLVDKGQFMNILSEEKNQYRELEFLRSKCERLEKENNTLKEAQNLSDIYNHPALNKNSLTYAPELRLAFKLWEYIYSQGIKTGHSHSERCDRFFETEGKQDLDDILNQKKNSNSGRLKDRLKAISNIFKKL